MSRRDLIPTLGGPPGIMMSLTFTVVCSSTNIGDTVLVVGDSPALGEWQAEQGLQLETGSEWPSWKATIDVASVNSSITLNCEFKVVIRRASGSIDWCPNPSNHQLEIDRSIEVEVKWGSPDLTVHTILMEEIAPVPTLGDDVTHSSLASGVASSTKPSVPWYYGSASFEVLESAMPSSTWNLSDGIYPQNYVDTKMGLIRSSSRRTRQDLSEVTGLALEDAVFDYSSRISRCQRSSSIRVDPSISFPPLNITQGRPDQDYEYSLELAIGEGMSGQIFKGVRRLDGCEAAIKEVSKLNEANSVEAVRRECSILQHLAPFKQSVVQLQTIYEDASDIHIVMDWYPHGDLFDLLQENDLEMFPESFLRRLFKSIIQSVYICHSNLVVHRDIKPENFLVVYDESELDEYLEDRAIEVRIIDFGLAIFCPNALNKDMSVLTGAVGTTFYCAPEVLNAHETGGTYGPGCDLWSVGCMMYLFMEGFPPYYGPDVDVHDQILRDEFKDARCIRTGYYDCYSPDLRDLVEKLLVKDPLVRLSCEEALGHPFFTSSGSYDKTSRSRSGGTYTPTAPPGASSTSSAGSCSIVYGPTSSSSNMTTGPSTEREALQPTDLRMGLSALRMQ